MKTMTTVSNNSVSMNFTTWANALRSGDKRYIMLAYADDWYLLAQHETNNSAEYEPELILSMDILVDEGNGLCLEYSYLIDLPDDCGFAYGMIIEDRTRMIVKDSLGYYAFGVEDETTPMDAMLIYARTEHRCITILATPKGCHVHTFDVD